MEYKKAILPTQPLEAGFEVEGDDDGESSLLSFPLPKNPCPDIRRCLEGEGEDEDDNDDTEFA